MCRRRRPRRLIRWLRCVTSNSNRARDQATRPQAQAELSAPPYVAALKLRTNFPPALSRNGRDRARFLLDLGPLFVACPLFDLVCSTVWFFSELRLLRETKRKRKRKN